MVKTILSYAAVSSVLLLSALPPGHAAEPAAGPDRKAVLQAAARALVAPSVYVATSTVRNTVRDARAFSAAKLSLSRQLGERFPARAAPDLALVRVWMQLALRINTGWLKTPFGNRAYPVPSDFDRFAQNGLDGMKRYSDSLGADHAWSVLDVRNFEDILYRELKKGVSRLPAFPGHGVPPAPPDSPEEEKYLPSR
jgi:hypothetical protein